MVEDHNNMENIWASQHPLGEGDIVIDLSDYAMLSTNKHLVCALKEGLKDAQKYYES